MTEAADGFRLLFRAEKLLPFTTSYAFSIFLRHCSSSSKHPRSFLSSISLKPFQNFLITLSSSLLRTTSPTSFSLRFIFQCSQPSPIFVIHYLLMQQVLEAHQAQASVDLDFSAISYFSSILFRGVKNPPALSESVTTLCSPLGNTLCEFYRIARLIVGWVVGGSSLLPLVEG